MLLGLLGGNVFIHFRYIAHFGVFFFYTFGVTLLEERIHCSKDDDEVREPGFSSGSSHLSTCSLSLAMDGVGGYLIPEIIL